MILGGGRQSVTGELSVAFEGLAQLHVDVLCWIVSHCFTAVTSCVMGRPMYFFHFNTNVCTILNPEVCWIGSCKLKLRV